MAGLNRTAPLGWAFGIPPRRLGYSLADTTIAGGNWGLLGPPLHKPGDEVCVSGIYEVVHDANHVQPHEVTCEVFPPCRSCGPHPRFRLVRAAQHITDDHCFNR